MERKKLLSFINGNFKNDDIVVNLSYSKNRDKEADIEIQNFLERIKLTHRKRVS